MPQLRTQTMTTVRVFMSHSEHVINNPLANIDEDHPPRLMDLSDDEDDGE